MFQKIIKNLWPIIAAIILLGGAFYTFDIYINVINFSRLVCNSSKSFFFFYDYVDNFVQA